VKRLLPLGAVLLLVVLPALTCRRAAPAAGLSIAAAADLRFALDELTAAFRRAHPEIAVSVSYGSSGTFFAQLVNGAPFDLFLSADVSYPRQLAARGLTIPGSEFTYAVGRIVVWVPASSPIDVARLGMRALDAPGVTHVSIANPEHAPYGRAAEAAMRSAGVYEAVRPKLVFGENVSQALQFVQSGSAEIGIVALSLAVSPAVAGSGTFWEVPLESYPRIEQGGTILRWSANPEAARLFRSLILADTGRAVLKRYGFFVDAWPQRHGAHREQLSLRVFCASVATWHGDLWTGPRSG
jgi:molybdate transport system substrate-binding protein